MHYSFMKKQTLYESVMADRDFLWGSATASFQVEGATREGGRSESVWDTFCRIPGRVHAGDTGDVSTDHYHRYKEDVQLLKDLGVGAYRFSLSWPRILPQGTGEPNAQGIAFYNSLIDELIAAGIKPVVTLYHWDHPQVLEDQGGWQNRQMAQWFLEYAKVCFQAFDDRVAMWSTINEPWSVAELGYRWGMHAPGIRDEQASVSVIHHMNLAHGLAVSEYRAQGRSKPIGIVLNPQMPRPVTQDPDDVLAADIAADRGIRMYLDPLIGKGYPQRWIDQHPDLTIPLEDGDLDIMAETLDYLGVNYYSEGVVGAPRTEQERQHGFRYCLSWHPRTLMDWPVVPEGITRMLHWLHDHTGGIPQYIMENGACYDDSVSIDVVGHGAEYHKVQRVHDHQRLHYISRHIAQVLKAREEGVAIKGYFVWSFIDNFEWSHGYSRRFGIVYHDYKTLERIPKDSYYWFRDLLTGYGTLDPWTD